MTDIPKLELHLHLEGAAPPAFIRGLAQEKKVDISGVFSEDGSYHFRDFSHFLQVYEAATSVLKTPEDYARLTRAVLEQSASHGVIYTEVFLSPDFAAVATLGLGGNTCTPWPRPRRRCPRSRCAASSPAFAISGPKWQGNQQFARLKPRVM